VNRSPDGHVRGMDVKRVVVVHALGATPELVREAAVSAGRGLGFAPSGSPPPTEDHRPIVVVPYHPDQEPRS